MLTKVRGKKRRRRRRPKHASRANRKRISSFNLHHLTDYWLPTSGYRLLATDLLQIILIKKSLKSLYFLNIYLLIFCVVYKEILFYKLKLNKENKKLGDNMTNPVDNNPVAPIIPEAPAMDKYPVAYHATNLC